MADLTGKNLGNIYSCERKKDRWISMISFAWVIKLSNKHGNNRIVYVCIRLID